MLARCKEVWAQCGNNNRCAARRCPPWMQEGAGAAAGGSDAGAVAHELE
jgi:hypothetical protein